MYNNDVIEALDRIRNQEQAIAAGVTVNDYIAPVKLIQNLLDKYSKWQDVEQAPFDTPVIVKCSYTDVNAVYQSVCLAIKKQIDKYVVWFEIEHIKATDIERNEVQELHEVLGWMPYVE